MSNSALTFNKHPDCVSKGQTSCWSYVSSLFENLPLAALLINRSVKSYELAWDYLGNFHNPLIVANYNSSS